MSVQLMRAECARAASAAHTFYHKYGRSPQPEPHCRTDRARFWQAAGPNERSERRGLVAVICSAASLLAPKDKDAGGRSISGLSGLVFLEIQD